MLRFHDLPDWDDEHLRNISEEEGEYWKPNPTREACKALYQQWQQVVYLLNAAFATIRDKPAEMPRRDGFLLGNWKDTAQSLMDEAMEAAVKIRSSETGATYVLRMEHAAIIRRCVGDIRTHLLMFEEAPGMDKKYMDVLREEIDIFRRLYKKWIATFEKDGFEDEWGLFV